MKLPTVTVVFNRLKSKNKKGMYSVHLRVTISRQSKYILIPLIQKVHPSDWNENHKGSNYIRNSNPYAFEINNNEDLQQSNNLKSCFICLMNKI